MKRFWLFISALLLLLETDRLNAQVNTLPYTQSFEDGFIMGREVEFLPHWLGNIVAMDTMFQETDHVYTGSGALAMIPQEEEFRNIANLYLDLTNKSNVAAEFWYASDENSGGVRFSRLMVAVSIDSGVTFFPDVSIGGAHKGLPNMRTPYQQYIYAFHPATAGQKNVVLKLMGRSGGGAGRHDEDDILEAEGGGPTPAAKLVIDDLTVFQSDIDSFPPLVLNVKVLNLKTLQVSFSEPMDTSANNALHYNFLQSETMVTSASRDADLDQVTLTLSPSLEIGKYYNLMLSDLYDTAGNAMIAADTVEFIYNQLKSGLVFSEIFYDEPPAEMKDDLEFIELYNATTEPIPLGGLRIRGGIMSHDLPEYTLQPGEYWVIAKDAATFTFVFGRSAHQWRGANLSNEDPEYLELVGTNRHSGMVIDSLTYKVGAPWPELAAGLGYSMELCNPFADNSDPANWSNATMYQGVFNGFPIYASPGQSCNEALKPIVNLGRDGNYCGFTTLTLDAANDGAIYKWSTGATSRSIIVNESGEYSVIVNNGYGVAYDTIHVKLQLEVVANTTLPSSPHCNNEVLAFTDATVGAVGWLWSFGDGTTSTLQNPNHTYFTAGEFDVTLLVTSVVGCTDVFEGQVEIMSIDPIWEVPQNPVCVNEPINFTTGTSSETKAISLLWDFGDGITSAEKNPAHSYSTKGLYDLSLIVTSDLGCKNMLTGQVQVTDITAAFNVPQTRLCANAAYEFQANVANAFEWSWNFGDGNFSEEENPAYVYTTAGTYTVSLQVNTQYGCSDVLSHEIEVDDLEAEWNFPEGMQCTNVETEFQALRGKAVSWEWNFGDGITSSEQNAEHIYISKGTYTVSLQTNSQYGCKDELTDTVEVSDIVATWTLPGEAICYQNMVNFQSTNQEAVSSSWQFGDGGTSDVHNPEYAYTEPGIHTVKLIVINEYGCKDEIKTQLDAVVCLGSEADNANLILYPNPISDFVRINSVQAQEAPVSLRLIQLNGNIIDQDLDWQQQGEILMIDLTHIPSGEYILEMYQQGKKRYWKVLKN